MKRQFLQTSNYTIDLEGEYLPVIIRKRASSRRMVIRYQPLTHSVSLTLPRYATIRQGLDFVEEKRGWIARQLQEKPSHVPFAHGQAIPLLGSHYTLHYVGGRGLTRIEGDAILVPGEISFMARRVRQFLIATAKEAIVPLAREKARELDRKLGRISLRDTVSHWGSCNHLNNLSFSWRLVLAPREVLDYVVCHEVAHLGQLNHSAAYWRTVAALCPDYEAPRQWLKDHGHSLYCYG
jgi:predicted metal-dependent hydrolase